MRHVRILVLCLVAAFATSAMTLSVAAPALAGGGCNQECKELKEKEKQEAKERKEQERQKAKEQKEKEKQEAKERKEKEREEARGRLSPAQLEKVYGHFKACPLDNHKIGTCVDAETEKGEYTVGSITIPFKKIILQGGEHELGTLRAEGCREPEHQAKCQEVDEDYPEESTHGYPTVGEFFASEVIGLWYGPENGESTLVAPPLKVPGGFTNRISPQPYWPQALTEKFEEAKKNHELTATETLQLAGRPWVSRANLLEEEDTAFHLPMMVVVNSPFLNSLGGGTCHVGSTEHPIVVELTSGESTGPFPYEYNTSHGSRGELFFQDEFNYVSLHQSTLVDNTFAVTTGAEGCGGEYEPYVDAALSKAAGVPSPSGANDVILSGTLFNGGNERTACVLKEDEEQYSKHECEEQAREEGLNL